MAKYLSLLIPACASVEEEYVMLQITGDDAMLQIQSDDAKLDMASGRGRYLGSMKERIMSLAQGKIPPDALPFLAEIKGSLSNDVLPSILDEKILQENFHNTLLNQFTTAQNVYAAAIGSHSDLQGEVGQAKSEHTSCRGLESIDHGETVTCASQEAVAQNTFDGHDSIVRSLSGGAGVCSVADVWRTGTVENLEGYSGALINVIASRSALDEKKTECARLQAELETQTGVCDDSQHAFEIQACTLAVGYHTAWQIYDGSYSEAKNSFEAEFSVWEAQSDDRVEQCQLVGTLVCYITALENNDDAAPLNSAIEDCDAGRAEACSHDVAFAHANTPDQTDKIPVPAAPCQDGFDYGEFPAGTSGGPCAECAGFFHVDDNHDDDDTDVITDAFQDCALDIDGGGWELVRHVPAGNQWHRATDQMSGTEEYGDPTGGSLSPQEWSRRFDTSDFSEFLFSTGDCQKWLIAEKDAVAGTFYSNDLRPIVKSSTNGGPYSARWYNRVGTSEDPWISLEDHGSAIGNGNILYGGNHYASAHASNVLPMHEGANVYIRG